MEAPENLPVEAVSIAQDAASSPVEVDAAVLLLGAGVTAITHPLLYVKLLIQVGHEPLPPTVGTTMFGRRVLYLPGFFSYAQHIVEVDGKGGLFRGLSPRIISSAISTVVRGKIKQQVQLRSKKDEQQTSLGKVIREVRDLTRDDHPVPVQSGNTSFPCPVSSLYGPVCWQRGEVQFSQASAVRSYTKFVMGIAVSVLTYPFMLVADVMAVNNCGLAAGLPPRSPVFKSWLHCWNHLNHKGHLFRGSSFFFRRVPIASLPSMEE
ncbi:mitochondrial carrier homolog 1-like isoform X2 [Melanotaenia boesemani]|uniref:mitochondrial carrier homolog 1-like isoform X2 n=1 Tax=Melanotaenia boesemani TaxID=1250792 RepID=UPI001C048408|nr:mitochondrial carrier homolog 1-like isoform X2 [Melanotaenia boesemani]